MKKLKVIPAISVMLMVSFFSLTNQAKAQQAKPINLKNAIQMALDSNLSVRASACSVKVQQALKNASWDIPKTTIEGQFGQINSYNNDNSFTVSQSFAFPTEYINRHKLANANVKSSEWQYKASQMEIAAQVKQVYWQLAYLYSKQKLLVYQDSLFSGFLRAAELRARSGETNRLEMITARSQSLEIKNQLQQTNTDIGIFNRKLQTVLNTDIAFYPADTVLRRSGSVPGNDSAAFEANPNLGYMNQQVEVTRMEKKLESSRAMPDFSIGYFSQTMQGIQDIDGVTRTFGKGDRFTGFQAEIAIPLWFGAYASKTKSARLKEQVAGINAEYYSKALSDSYLSLLDEYRKYASSVDYYEKQAVPEANLIIEHATRSYKAGALDYLEYILALNRALGIRQNYLDALNDYNKTLISIDLMTGKTF